MSFSPPTPPNPLDGPGGRPPRSTPIPGGSTQLPGNFGAAPPPTPSEFVSAPAPGRYQAAPAVPFGDSPRRGRSLGSILFVVIIFAGPIIGIGVGVWAFLRSRDASQQTDEIFADADETADSLLADEEDALDDVTVPGVQPTVFVTLAPAATSPATSPGATAPAATVSLFDEGGAPAVVAAFEAAISGEPSRFMQIILYPDYAFASAQDANTPTHVDEYPWREGAVGASSPVTLFGDGDLEASLFSASDVDWAFIARAVVEAPTTLAVEEGAVSHIIVDRSVFTDDFSVVVRVYVTGPRGGGYVEYTPAGEFISAVQ
ncbi:MAG: hypothetical protein FD127_3910 [Acidimicrobiaceae bacterium]|nr:MAG: hypothetical protein FD127_3910 [Acidimicrobiaceae bacterium]